MTKSNPDPYGLTRRRFLHVSGMALGGLVVAACGGGEATSTTLAPTTTATGGATTTTGGATTTTGGGTTTTAGMSVPQSDFTAPLHFDFQTPNRSLQAPYLVGMQKGWFEEVGIDLQLDNITGLDDYLTPVLGGDIQIALMDASVIFPAEYASVQGGDPTGLRWIGCNLGAQPVVMIANEGVTAENLPGKKVGGARAGTTNEALCKFILDQLGYDWQTDVDFINLTGGSNDWVTAMLAGQIDATIAFPRHIALAEEAGGSAIYNKPREDPQAGFGVLQSFLDQYPNFAVAWDYAYIRSQQWMKDSANWDEARDIIVNDLGLDYPDNTFAALDIEAGIMTTDFGWNPDLMDQWLEFLQPYADIPPEMDWREYVALEPLHAAQEALGLPVNPEDLNNGVTNL